MENKENEILIESIAKNVEELIILYFEAKNENTKLKKDIESKEQQLKDIKEKYNSTLFNKTISLGNSDVKYTKEKMQKMIREIDKCIELIKAE